MAEPEPETEQQRLTRLAAAANWPGRILVIPDAQIPGWQPKLNFAQHWVADSTRIRQELGYAEAVDLQEAMRRSVAWQRAHLRVEVSPFLLTEAQEDSLLAGS